MKIQDFLYVITVALLLVFARRRPRLFVWLGLLSLTFSIPLFAFWVFFTAQRLVYYAAGLFFIAIILILFHKGKK